MAAVKAPTLRQLKVPQQKAPSQQGSTLPKAGDFKPSQAAPVKKAELLLGEGQVGSYKSLKKVEKPGDNLTPHHMPQDAYMKQHNVHKNDGIALMMEHPHPGKGGRHRQTRTYGKKPNLSETPREALARDVKDARNIYREDGVHIILK